MSTFFDLLVSPLGLNINPIAEWVIMLIVGEIAYRYAYYKVGELDLGIPIINFVLHWTIRAFIYFLLWLVCRIVSDGYNLINNLFKMVFNKS